MRKVLSIIFSLILLFSIFTTVAYAEDPLPEGSTAEDSIIDIFNGDYFIKAGSDSETGELINNIDKGLGKGLEVILVFLYQIGDVIAICILVSFGIKYVVATPQKKADLKASIYPYFVGLLLYIVGVPIAILIIKIFIKVF